MMKKVTVKQLTMLSLFVAMAWSVSSQMKVGDNPNIINKGSILELEAKDKGVLYPRVALTASNAWLPLQGTTVAGMTVYNTATVTATTSATISLSPGFYFWEGDKWNKIATESKVETGVEWKDGTVSGTNLIYANQAKTTGNDVVITDEGKVGIANDAPKAFIQIGKSLLGEAIGQAVQSRLTGKDISLTSASGRFSYGSNFAYILDSLYTGGTYFYGRQSCIDINNVTSSLEKIVGDYIGVYDNRTTLDTLNIIISQRTHTYHGGKGFVKNMIGQQIETGFYDYVDPNNSQANLNGGTIKQQIGLQILDVKSGTDNNYAIYTNAGAVHFGDKVGIGTTTPTEKLDVNGSVKIADGTQGVGKVLTSDATGKAHWETPGVVASTVSSQFGAGVTITNANKTEWLNTGTTITLPPGKWVITANLVFGATMLNGATNEGGVWVRATWCDSATATAKSADIISNSSFISGGLAWNMIWGTMMGAVIIHNQTGANKIYYLKTLPYRDSIGTGVVLPPNVEITNFGGTINSENIIWGQRLGD